MLFLACYFPPASAIGCVRTWNVAKYLARIGWDVSVVTPHPSVWRDVYNPEKTTTHLKREGIDRILTAHRWRCLKPDRLNCSNRGFGWFVGGVCRKIARSLRIDNHIGWIRAAERACSTFTPREVDVILATGPPFVSFRLAEQLSHKLECPYVLDYRDPWRHDPYTPARRAWFGEEARLLANSAAVTSVSRSWGLDLEYEFALGSKLHVVSNGYDPEDLAEVRPHKFGHFAIVYTGTFSPPKRVISPVMIALRRFRETMKGNGQKWYFHYYGQHGKHVHEEATRFGVMDQVVLHGKVSRTEALSAVRGASVAVVITSIANKPTLADKGMVTGKLFEVLGLGTPALLVAPSNSDVETIVEDTGLARTFTASNTDGMASFLMEVLHGKTPQPRDPELYAWTSIIRKMDYALRGAMETLPRLRARPSTLKASQTFVDLSMRSCKEDQDRVSVKDCPNQSNPYFVLDT